MISLTIVPKNLDEIISVYGNPDATGDMILDPVFLTEHIVVRTLPFPMVASWNERAVVSKVQVHRLVADSMMDALEEIRDYRGLEYLRANRYDRTGGVFCFRPMRNGEKLSAHSWGIAVDINPHLGPLGRISHGQPEFIIEAFEKRGWRNLAADRMHFEATAGF